MSEQEGYLKQQLNGSPGRARTADLVINSHPLYRLSYRGIENLRERASYWISGFSVNEDSLYFLLLTGNQLACRRSGSGSGVADRCLTGKSRVASPARAYRKR